MKAVRILISGKVQGVFFRVSTKKIAQEYSICGWCRNTKDGKVDIFAQGYYKRLDDFLKWCNDGPDTARVDNVEVELVAPQNFESFEIRY